jgi:hypothetical protein
MIIPNIVIIIIIIRYLQFARAIKIDIIITLQITK